MPKQQCYNSHRPRAWTGFGFNPHGKCQCKENTPWIEEQLRRKELLRPAIASR